MMKYHEFPLLDFESIEDSVTAFAAACNAHGIYPDAVILYASLLCASQTAINMTNALRNQDTYSEAEAIYKSATLLQQNSNLPTNVTRDY